MFNICSFNLVNELWTALANALFDPTDHFPPFVLSAP